MEATADQLCHNCRAPVPEGHAFCGKCGAKTDDKAQASQTQFFSQMQVPGRAKLILIKGEGLDGISYHLNAVEHVAGRRQGAILFPEDEFLSPRHANFYYHDGRIHVRDEGSLNGVFIRIRGPYELIPGDIFMAGEEIFRFEEAERSAGGPSQDGTLFYHSPTGEARYQVAQLLAGGRLGGVHVDTKGSTTIGRERCDLSFPQDTFLSAKHCRVEVVDGRCLLTDLRSKNGTYIRIHESQRLDHGDYVFIGSQLLRVEITV